MPSQVKEQARYKGMAATLHLNLFNSESDTDEPDLSINCTGDNMKKLSVPQNQKAGEQTESFTTPHLARRRKLTPTHPSACLTRSSATWLD